MRIIIFTLLISITFTLSAQRVCSSYDYRENQLSNNLSLENSLNAIENFVQGKTNSRAMNVAGKPHTGSIIKIPVVVHILYNKAHENISDERIYNQIKVLNERFRRLHADTVNTPQWYKSIAADCGIEFQLATSDPQQRGTKGITRKYTPVSQWNTDDKVKFSSSAGSDAWDPESYLNIWVCNLGGIAGYSGFPGGPPENDGIVIAYSVFGENTRGGYQMGKTAVHEVGHWLGLRHIWGDSYCGDDWVSDTPKQANFTSGCPSGIRSSCNNGPNGDMYMNYMDLTQDACTNLFTEGQKERMRIFFEVGGARRSLLSSKGLLPPLTGDVPPTDGLPEWNQPKLFPNPAVNEITLDLSYDYRWIGNIITITNAQGQFFMQVSINTKTVKINLDKLSSGIYFLVAKRQDGASINHKFIKL